MNKTVITVIIVLVILIGAISFVTKNPQQSSTTTSPTPVADSATEPAPTYPPADPELLAGGSSHMDKDGIYSLLYPNDYTVDSPGEGITRFYKQGPSQQGQTEMYDGVNFTIITQPLNGKTIEQWVDEEIKTSTGENGTSELIEGKKPITVNNQSGYTYKVRS